MTKGNMVLDCAVCGKREQVVKGDTAVKCLQTTFMMHSGARSPSSNVPQSDTDSPLVPGSGDKHMMRRVQPGEYGGVDNEDTERVYTGAVHVLSCKHA